MFKQEVLPKWGLPVIEKEIHARYAMPSERGANGEPSEKERDRESDRYRQKEEMYLQKFRDMDEQQVRNI